MARGFVGRTAELTLLDRRLARVTESDTGLAVAIRGRRQVGKSRLVQEFCDRSGTPYLFYTATKGASPVEAVAALLAELRDSGLARDRNLVPADAAAGWPDAFRVLAAVLPDSPVVIVLDELPWLAEQDDLFDGALQTAWDRLLSRRPVLLLLLGSDLHMMERLTAYDQPFYGRADNLLLGPLNPAEVGAALGLEAADAIDAYMMSGGLPGILRAWPAGTTALAFAEGECDDPASPLFGVPETALLAEFPGPDMTRRVIEAIGGGDRTYANIAAEAGSRAGIIPSGTLSPVLHRLVTDKHVLAADEPLSVRAGKPMLYRVADSNLRFYLAIGRAAQEWSRRGRPASAKTLLRRRWTSWRGRAVEPVIREALSLSAGDLPWPEAIAVGGWWNRAFQPEIDLVGADRAPVAREIYYAGSVKWLDRPFDDHDFAALQRDAIAVPGFEPGRTRLAVVSRAGAASSVTPQLALCWGPRDVVAAFSGSAGAREELLGAGPGRLASPAESAALGVPHAALKEAPGFTASGDAYHEEMAGSAGVVLAGGQSSRMGTAKAALEWHGSTLLRRTVGIVARAAEGPVVVVRAGGQDLPDLPKGTVVVDDPREGKGPVQGIAAGLAALSGRAEAAFVCSTDMPFLHPAFVRRVLRLLAEREGTDIALPVARGYRQPLAAAYRVSLAEAAERLVKEDRLRPAFLFEQCVVASLDDDTLRQDPVLAALDPDLDSVLNVNTPADYQQARARPEPEVTIQLFGTLARGDSARGPRAVRAATVDAAARAADLTFDRHVTAALNGDQITRDGTAPLATGDIVFFMSADAGG